MYTHQRTYTILLTHRSYVFIKLTLQNGSLQVVLYALLAVIHFEDKKFPISISLKQTDASQPYLTEILRKFSSILLTGNMNSSVQLI